jgi:hypothetical protein
MIHIQNTCKKNNTINLEKKITALQNEMEQIKANTKYNIIGNTINNNMINITINKVGNENILDLNEKEIRDIFDKNIESLVKFVELLNFNDRLPSNHNFCSTSLENPGPYLSYFNTDKLQQEKERKKYFLKIYYTDLSTGWSNFIISTKIISPKASRNKLKRIL